MQRFYLIMPSQVGWNFRKGQGSAMRRSQRGKAAGAIVVSLQRAQTAANTNAIYLQYLLNHR
jgi:hypothetical protein